MTLFITASWAALRAYPSSMSDAALHGSFWMSQERLCRSFHTSLAWSHFALACFHPSSSFPVASFHLPITSSYAPATLPYASVAFELSALYLSTALPMAPSAFPRSSSYFCATWFAVVPHLSVNSSAACVYILPALFTVAPHLLWNARAAWTALSAVAPHSLLNLFSASCLDSTDMSSSLSSNSSTARP